jgi:hypothetical protein
LSTPSRARSFYRDHVKVAIAAHRPFPPPAAAAVVISGSPRSGTTWLAELLSSAPRSAIIWEPLHLTANPRAAAAGFDWRTYRTPGERWPEGQRYLTDVLRGRELSRFAYSRASLVELLGATTLVVKFVRANGLLAWMSELLPGRPPIHLVRHPCAVVASQLRYPEWKDADPIGASPSFFAHHPGLRAAASDLATLEERLAAMWAMDNFVLRSAHDAPPWMTVTYEQLLTNGAAELQRIAQRLELALAPGVADQLATASGTTSLEDGDRHRAPAAVDSWQEVVSPEQVDRILTVVRRFGLELYDDQPLPDNQQLK